MRKQQESEEIKIFSLHFSLILRCDNKTLKLLGIW